jgi:Tol biopolymer transport system component
MAVCAVLAGCAGCTEERTVAGPPPPPPPPPPQLGYSDGFPAWSPDGRTVAYVSAETDSNQINIRAYIRLVDVGTYDTTTILRDDQMFVFDLAWSPDGHWLLLSTEVGIFKMLATGDSLTLLKVGEFHVSASWSSVSNRIFFGINGGSEGGIYSMQPDGSNLQRWTYPASGVMQCPYVFPDSDTLVVQSYDANGDYCIALYYPHDVLLEEVLACGLPLVAHPRPAPDQRSVFFVGFDTAQEIQRIYNLKREFGVSTPLTGATSQNPFSVSPDGNYIVYHDAARTRGLQIISIRTGQVFQLTRKDGQSVH